VALRLRVPELGDRVTIVTIEPGEILGWSAVVAPYRATVDAVATERARILVFDAGTLRERLASDDALAAALLPEVLEAVSRRLTTSWHQLLDLFATRGQEAW
jgi:CRP-like cAMP-binding protein